MATTKKGTPYLGNWLKKLREGKGLKQEELAQKCRVTGGTISLIERGLRKPGAKLSARLGRALDTDVQDIFFAAHSTEDRAFALGHQKLSLGDHREEEYDSNIEGLVMQLYRLRKTLSPYDYKTLHASLAAITGVFVQNE